MHKERLLHHVIISVYCKAYERQAEVLAGLDIISPMPTAQLLALDPAYDPERPRTLHYRTKDVTLTTQETESDDGTMTIYTLYFRKIHDTTAFVRKAMTAFPPEERARIVEEPNRILDEDGRLPLRLEKRSPMRGEIAPTTGGDCYAVKAALAAYPKTRQRVEEMARRIAQDL